MRSFSDYIGRGLTKRKVVAFMSDNHIDPDVGTETFLLAPALEPAAGDCAAPS